MTSCEVMVNFTGMPMGTWSSLISRGPSECCRCHIHCLPMTKISVEASGGRPLRTYRLEAQTNSTTQMSEGIIVQVNSRAMGVGVAVPDSPGALRRYFSM